MTGYASIKHLSISIIAGIGFTVCGHAHSSDSLRVSLLKILDEDQHYRAQSDSIRKNFGPQSYEVKKHDRLIKERDSLNIIQVKYILDIYGWVGKQQVGEAANTAIFLVIQHADFATQEHYLPIMREAVKRGDADPGQLALLEDRVALKKGKKQIYGSQIRRDPVTEKFFLAPLDDPANVDKRRAEVGLGALKDYLKQWNIDWPEMKESQSRNHE